MWPCKIPHSSSSFAEYPFLLSSRTPTSTKCFGCFVPSSFGRVRCSFARASRAGRCGCWAKASRSRFLRIKEARAGPSSSPTHAAVMSSGKWRSSTTGPVLGMAVVVAGGHAHQLDAQEFHAMRATFVPAVFKVLRKVCLDLCGRLRQTNERIVASGRTNVQTPRLPAGPRPTTEILDAFPPFLRAPVGREAGARAEARSHSR